jgi:predicted HTH domain antitoxin
MTAILEIDFPATLLLHAPDAASLQRRSRFLLALKYFELGELSSGQAGKMCGMSRAAFLLEAAHNGVPATDLGGEELEQEFADG